MLTSLTLFLDRVRGVAADSPPIIKRTDAQPKHISTPGLAMVKHFESCFLTAYKDGKHASAVLTIGWGHTGLQHMDGTVYRGRTITQAEADRLLAYDMAQFEARVRAWVKVPLKQWQFDALVCWDFNTGGLAKGSAKAPNKPPVPSTLLRLLNAGDVKGAAEQFLRWNKDNGKVVDGLTRRRYAEREMFLGGDWKLFSNSKTWKSNVSLAKKAA